jgi:fucose 4-O-acetylase-like acetyltransferase
MLPIIIRMRYNVIAIFCFSLVIGFFDEFGSFLALSRTICFFGYFLLGYYSKENIYEKIKEKKLIITISVIITSVLLYIAFTSEYGVSHVGGIILSLYRSTAYKNMGMPRINGFIFRIMTIPLSILFSMLVLAYTPLKENIFTGIGKRSIIIFVFHGYLIRILRKIITIDENSFSGILILIIVSISMTLFLSIPLFYKIYNCGIRCIEKIIIKE